MPGAARRIACFATSAHSATPVVAYAESGGLDPKIHVHQVDTLELVTTLDGGAHQTRRHVCTCLGVDESDFRYSFRRWRRCETAGFPTETLPAKVLAATA